MVVTEDDWLSVWNMVAGMPNDLTAFALNKKSRAIFLEIRGGPRPLPKPSISPRAPYAPHVYLNKGLAILTSIGNLAISTCLINYQERRIKFKTSLFR